MDVAERNGSELGMKIFGKISKLTHFVATEAQLRLPLPRWNWMTRLTTLGRFLHPLHPLLVPQGVEDEREPVLCNLVNPKLWQYHVLLTSETGFLCDRRLCSRVFSRGIILTNGMPFIFCLYSLRLMLVPLIK